MTYFTVINPVAGENGAKKARKLCFSIRDVRCFIISYIILAERSGDGLVVFSKYPSVFYNAMTATIQYTSNIFEQLHFICYRINDA